MNGLTKISDPALRLLVSSSATLGVRPIKQVEYTYQLDDTDGIDTYIASNSPTTNLDGTAAIAVGESNAASAVFRTLITPKLSDIPSAKLISVDYAYLDLTIRSDLSSTARTAEIFRVLRNRLS